MHILATAARVALAGRRVLLVADDCDHVVAAAAEQLTALVRAVPGLRVVATSRQPLGVSEERVLPVPPPGCPAGPGLAAVRESAAGRLFLDRAGAASPRLRLDEAAASHVADICRRLDGLPLARELLDGALTVFRQAGDFRCTARVLLELATHHRAGDPAAAAGLLRQALEMAMLAGGGLLRTRVLVGLAAAAAAAGDLALAARALGVLDALGHQPSPAGTPGGPAAVPADLAGTLRAAAYRTYREEGQAGGISLILTLYPG